MRRLLPSIEGIEANPLYLRLARKRFVRGGFFERMPQELRAPDAWQEALVYALCIVALGGIMIASCEASIAASLGALFEIFSLGFIMRVNNFASGLQTRPWGEGMRLTPMQGRDYSRAVIAALIEGRSRLYFRGCVIGWLVISWFTWGMFRAIHQPPQIQSTDHSNEAFLMLLGAWLGLVLGAALLAAELTTFAALNCLGALIAFKGTSPTAGSSMGVCAKIVVAWNILHLPIMFASYLFGFGSVATSLAAYAYTAVALIVQWLWIRASLDRSEASFGRLLAESLDRG